LSTAWRTKQVAGNVTDPEDGFLKGKRYILMDRDTEFCEAFREILKSLYLSTLVGCLPDS